MSNMKESQTHTAEWKKSYTKESIVCDLYEVLEQEKLIYGGKKE